ncbi:hypothetical protein GCM10018771_62880 [Streptomyces cellulosae]|nr:hypothetical protein GCM10018771_62880 [Streptomyces cellulosae]
MSAGVSTVVRGMGAARPMWGETTKTPPSLGGRPEVPARPPSMWTALKRRVTFRSLRGARHAAAGTFATLV